MPMLARPGGSINYTVAGEGGVPLLLTHGFGATSAMFAGNVPALSARNRVVIWDILGHGRSDSPDDPTSYGAAAALADMVALMDGLGIGKAVLAGHSLGGYLSLDFALAHPDRVCGLVLIDTGPGYRNDTARDDWNRRAEGTATRITTRGLESMRGSPELHAGHHRDPRGVAMAARYTLTQRDSHVMDGLPTIQAPTLIIVGANDEPYAGAANYMAAKIPLARKVVIPDAGHAPNVSQPTIFDAEVGAFLTELAEAGEKAS